MNVEVQEPDASAGIPETSCSILFFQCLDFRVQGSSNLWSSCPVSDVSDQLTLECHLDSFMIYAGLSNIATLAFVSVQSSKNKE
jgi:hypothetical protein